MAWISHFLFNITMVKVLNNTLFYGLHIHGIFYIRQKMLISHPYSYLWPVNKYKLKNPNLHRRKSLEKYLIKNYTSWKWRYLITRLLNLLNWISYLKKSKIVIFWIVSLKISDGTKLAWITTKDSYWFI